MSSISFKNSIPIIFLIIMAWSCATTSKNQVKSSEKSDVNHEAIYWANVKKERQNYIQADANFMIGMIGHHAQALIMSRLAPKNDASEQVQTLASRIINAQKGEIKRMQRWLRQRNEPVPEVTIHGLHLMIETPGGQGMQMHHNHMNMPGMLSQEQLEELASARGIEFNHLFLKYMIQHHSGALIMVEKLVSTPGAAQGDLTYQLVAGISADQRTEIARMKRMLERITRSSNSN